MDPMIMESINMEMVPKDYPYCEQIWKYILMIMESKGIKNNFIIKESIRMKMDLNDCRR